MRAKCRATLRNVCSLFAHDERGVSATEYAILLSLLIIGSMGVLGAIGESFAALYTIITNALPPGLA